MKRTITVVLALLLTGGMALGQSNNGQKKDKDKKTDNSENYTVHKSGDGGGGSPTYSTGGLNPNPGKDQPKKEQPKKKQPKKDKKDK